MKYELDGKGKPLVGGWLYLPALGTFILPFFEAYSCWEIVGYLPAASAMQGNAKALVLASALVELAFLIAAVANVYFLWVRSGWYPKVFIAINGLTPVSMVFFNSLAASFFSYKLTFDDERDLIRAVVVAIVWIPYMLLSKRVRDTFGWPPPRAPKPAKPPRAKPPHARRAHRLGIFVTVASLPLFIIGIAASTSYNHTIEAWAVPLAWVGAGGVFLGYALTRLWFWATAPEPQS